MPFINPMNNLVMNLSFPPEHFLLMSGNGKYVDTGILSHDIYRCLEVDSYLEKGLNPIQKGIEA